MPDCELGHGRLVVLAAANALDKVGNKAARTQITAAKVYVPSTVLRILDIAMQVSRALWALYVFATTSEMGPLMQKIGSAWPRCALLVVSR